MKKICVEQVQEEDRLKYCIELEKGNVLYFPSSPLNLEILEKGKDPNFVQEYSERVQGFLGSMLKPYASYWRMSPGKLSFWKSKTWKKSELYLDNFMPSPLKGERVLRFFTNVQKAPSRWVVEETLPEIIQRLLGKKLSLPRWKGGSWVRGVSGCVKRALRWKETYSSYEAFMKKLYKVMRKDREFSGKGAKKVLEFAPGSSWLMFTDQISNAAFSEGEAFEQSFVIPHYRLLFPESTPVCLLERMAKHSLISGKSE